MLVDRITFLSLGLLSTKIPLKIKKIYHKKIKNILKIIKVIKQNYISN